MVRANSIAASIFQLCKRVGVLSEHQKRTTFLLPGADPFHASSDFAALFDRSALPVDVGGTLATGSHKHCCRGVPMPALSDADAVWAFYEERLSPSLKNQVDARNTPVDVEASALVEGLLFPPTELKAARSRHKNSPKDFACFLSHDEQVCATEAGKIKEQLESLLDAKVSLGKIILFSLVLCHFLHIFSAASRL